MKKKKKIRKPHKLQRIKPKFQKYSNFLFLIVTATIFALLYFFAKKNDFFINPADFKTETKGFGSLNRNASDSFQPGSKSSNFPGKLKWGKDFDFAKQKKKTQ